MRLPASFSDQRALQEAYTLFRVNGLCSIALFSAMLLIGRLTDAAHGDENTQIRYAVLIALPLAWMATMVGGAFLIEARGLQLWLRTGPTEDVGTLIARNMTIVFGVVGANLIVIGLAACCLMGWITFDAGILI